MAKRLCWFRKMHKEEEQPPEESEAKEGKPETMAKRLRWFKRLRSYNQWRLRTFGCFVPSWRWRRVSTFFDDLAFRLLYSLEAIVLVSALCFFFLCCGCHV